jgi:hypothetical protein
MKIIDCSSDPQQTASKQIDRSMGNVLFLFQRASFMQMLRTAIAEKELVIIRKCY